MSAIDHVVSGPSSGASSAEAGIRVAVLDDHPAMRAGVEAMLAPAPDLRFVGGAAGERDLWPLLAREHPRVLVLDLHHPGRDGLVLCLEVKFRHAATAVVLYSAAPDPELGIAAAIAGADAILSKASPAADLLDAVRFSAVSSAGPPPVSSELTSRAAARLDPSEHAIFAMRLAGNSPAEIADTLSLPVPVIGQRIVAIAELLATTARPPGTAGHHGRTGARPRPSAHQPPRRRRI